MLLANKRYTLFTYFQMAGQLIWPTKPHSKQASLPSNLYRTLSQLPMGSFLDCLCDEAYESLIIDGTATTEQVMLAWGELLYDYYDAKGDVFSSEDFQMSIHITRIQNHLFLLQSCVDYLYGQWSESIAASLNKLGYRFKPASKWPLDYRKELDTIVARSRAKYVQLQQLIKQREAKREAAGPVPKPTREYFEKLLVQVEEMQKTTYDLESMTVAKFVHLEKKYWKLVETIKQKTKK